MLCTLGPLGEEPYSLAPGGFVCPRLCICGSILRIILLSFHPVSVLFSQVWQCFCCYTILKNLVSLSCNSWGPSHQTRGSSTDLSWLIASLTLGTAEMVDGIHKLTGSTPYLFRKQPSSHTLGPITKYTIWIGSKISKLSIADSSLLNNSFLKLSLSSHILVQQGEQGAARRNQATPSTLCLEMFSAKHPSSLLTSSIKYFPLNDKIQFSQILCNFVTKITFFSHHASFPSEAFPDCL